MFDSWQPATVAEIVEKPSAWHDSVAVCSFAIGSYLFKQ
jgi:hypothetical protein